MMKPIQYLFLLFLVTICGCESLVTTLPEDKLPQTESKLVVQSFISPQAAKTNIVVTESAPLFGETSGSQNAIKNALVKISDGVTEVVVPFDSLSSLYSIEKARFPIVAGKTYTITVSDSKRKVNATCTVPANLPAIKSYVIDTTYAVYGFSRDTIITVKMHWQDIASETNYYRVRASLNLEYSTMEGSFVEKRVRNRFNFRWDDTIGRNDFQNDANLDGTTFVSPLGKYTLPSSYPYTDAKGNQKTFYPKNKIVGITFEVNNTDEAYFKYHRSLETSQNDNPFTEPSLIFTNINGGLGCFGAYNTAQLIYRP